MLLPMQCVEKKKFNNVGVKIEVAPWFYINVKDDLALLVYILYWLNISGWNGPNFPCHMTYIEINYKWADHFCVIYRNCTTNNSITVEYL